jgi:hypothetical protein
MYVLESTQGDLPTTKEGRYTTLSSLLEFDQSQKRHIKNNPIENLGNKWEECTPHRTQPMRNSGRDLPIRQYNACCNSSGCLCSPGTRSCKITIKVSLLLYSMCILVHSLSLTGEHISHIHHASIEEGYVISLTGLVERAVSET